VQIPCLPEIHISATRLFWICSKFPFGAWVLNSLRDFVFGGEKGIGVGGRGAEAMSGVIALFVS